MTPPTAHRHATDPTLVYRLGGSRAWAVWGAAIAVYVLAVFHRTSLGVAGLEAADRFGISSSQLSTFTIVQVFVYAAMQLPVGALLDRYGSKRMLVVGLTLLTVAQLGFAFVEGFPAALACRVLLGMGDAMVFISVLRLVALWFSPRRTPMVTQLTGVLGQLGALVAAGPLAAALHHFGWTPSYAAAASVGVLTGVALVVVVKDSPYADHHRDELKLRAIARTLRAAWLVPGTRLGLWSHFTSQFAATVFTLLWGYPFLVQGQGWSEAAASTLLMGMTAWAVVSGLALARLVGRLPYWRSWIVVGIVSAMVVPWTVVLLWPGPAPVWIVVVMACTTATGGPASMVGFDLARTFTPVQAIGRANGLVNVGGFTASLLTMALIGVVLDLVEPGGMDAYTLDDYRLALSVQYLFWGFGVVQILRYRRRGLAHLARVHPGATEQLKAGRPFVHPGIGTDGV